MTGQKIGYVRVSSVDQNPERQLDSFQIDRVFTDKASGKDRSRPQLEELIHYARAGDTVVVHSMDRLARNLDDLRALVQELTSRGIAVEFIHEHLTFTGQDTPMATLLLSVMGAFAEFERALIRERQLEGIAVAKTKGAYKGRKKVLTPKDWDEIKQAMLKPGVNKTKLATDYGISRGTLYRYLNLEPALAETVVQGRKRSGMLGDAVSQS
jgi:DNA invertase Pin-like site-specific DNA recombinase